MGLNVETEHATDILSPKRKRKAGGKEEQSSKLGATGFEKWMKSGDGGRSFYIVWGAEREVSGSSWRREQQYISIRFSGCYQMISKMPTAKNQKVASLIITNIYGLPLSSSGTKQSATSLQIYILRSSSKTKFQRSELRILAGICVHADSLMPSRKSRHVFMLNCHKYTLGKINISETKQI